MSDDAIRALRAEAGQKEAEAKAMEASQQAQPPPPPAAAAPPPPGDPAAAVPAGVAAAAAELDARTVPGTAPGQEFTLADFDGMSPDEQRAFALTDAGDAAIDAARRRGER
jgi:hypothetical protein